MPNTDNRKQEPDASQTCRTPQSRHILLCERVAFVHVDGLGHGGGYCKGDTGADLEGCVDLFLSVFHSRKQ